MVRNEHEQTLQGITSAFRSFAVLALAVSNEQLSAARDAVSKADAVGWAVDPTAYMRAQNSGSLQRQKKLLDLFAKTRAELCGIFPDLAAMLAASTDGE